MERQSLNATDIVQLPIRVHWAGWDSDTNRLKRAGWQVSASERPALTNSFYTSISLALTDPDGRMMILGDFQISMQLFYSMRAPDDLITMLCKTGIAMKCYKSTDRVTTYNLGSFDWEGMEKLRPCDGFANIPTNIPNQIKQFSDLSIFNYTERAREIYIPYKSVDDCLNRILELQWPEQKDLLKNSSQEIDKPIIQAKIYALAA